MAVPVSFYVPSSSVVVAVLRPRPRSCPPAAGEDAQVGPPEGGVAQRVQNLENKEHVNRGSMKLHISCYSLSSQFAFQSRPPISNQY